MRLSTAKDFLGGMEIISVTPNMHEYAIMNIIQA
jgi:hypothetical protein